MDFLQTLLQNKLFFIARIGEAYYKGLIRHSILRPTYHPRLFITPLNDERAQLKKVPNFFANFYLCSIIFFLSPKGIQ